jgi:hypothetical protein
VRPPRQDECGWFYGFKLHLVVNDYGELLSVRLTPGNTDDRRPVPELVKGLFGKLFGDKGYVSQPLLETLYTDGVQLITPFKVRMRNRLLPLLDKIMLRKRAIIESVSAQEHLADRTQPPWLGRELLRQLGGWPRRLHLAGEEAKLEHPCQRAIAACFLSSLTSNSR